jgi:hypothetical protein
MGSLDLGPGFFEPRVARRTSVWCVDRASIIRDSRIGLLCNTDEDTCKFRDLKEPETERKIRALSIWNKYPLESDFQISARDARRFRETSREEKGEAWLQNGG